MDLKDKKLKILKETVEYYSPNPEKKRCQGITLEGYKKCYYSGITANKETDGCAIGRLLTLEQRQNIDKNFSEGITIGGLITNHSTYLPEDIIELGFSFLEALQDLHDTETSWADEGLSMEGLARVKNIQLKIEQGEY